MKNFLIKMPMKRYFELSGTITKRVKLYYLEKHPCEIQSRKMKPNLSNDVSLNTKTHVMHYKIKMLDSSLYPKHSIKEVYLNDLFVEFLAKPAKVPVKKTVLKRKDIETAVAEKYPGLRIVKGKNCFKIHAPYNNLLKLRISDLPKISIDVTNINTLSLEQWVESIENLFAIEKN